MKTMIRLGIIGLMLIPVSARADTGLPRRLDIGGKVGIIAAKHGGAGANDQSVSASYVLGYTVGGTFGARLTNLLAAQAEIALTGKGSHSTKDGAPNGTYRMLYLEVPALLRIAPERSGGIEYGALLGPSLGILLDADFDRADGEHWELDSSFERFDVGLVLGADIAFDIASKGKLTVDARYNLGLRNIDKTAAPVDDDVVTRAFYLTVGYRANLADLLHGFPTPSRADPDAR